MVEPWTIQELSKTFQSLAVQESLPVRLCLFVDGLDEFEGDMEELCEVLASLARSSHVKLVISSRPWNVFENHFGQNTSKKLYMHELTEQDILRVATGRLESHPRWHDTVAMATTDSYNRRKHPCLVSRIFERASGVFLWVWLVTQSLRNGLSNHDTMDDLESRLDALPVDLERLFEHMFEQIDPFYHKLGAESLLLVLHASKPLTLQMLYHHKIGRNHGLSYALDRSDKRQIDEDQVRKAMLPGINAISGGLLEVHNSATIGFLHGTVRDFLLMEKTRQLVASKVCPDFDAYFSLSQAFVADHKLSTRENNTIHRKGSSNYGPASKVWINPPPHLDFISKIQPRSWDGGILLLDELEYNFTKLSLSQSRNQYLDKVFTFRNHLVSYDLSWYLEAKLATSTASDYLEPFKIKGHSPLFTSLTTEQTFSIDVVKLLLQHGEDINLCSKYFQFSGYSPWTFFCLKTMHEISSCQPCARVAELVKLLLRGGANPREVFESRDYQRISVFSAFISWMRVEAIDGSVFGLVLEALDSFIRAGAEFGLRELTEMFGGHEKDRQVLTKEKDIRVFVAIMERVISKCALQEHILLEIRRQIPQRLPAYRAQSLIAMVDARLAARDDRNSAKKRGRDEDVN